MPARLCAICTDITTLNVDAIVNAANASLLPVRGVCGAIHRTAGPELEQKCRVLGDCPTGDAKLTRGYRLSARYVIHAVGPVWTGGNNGEPAQLASRYCRSLKIAAKNRTQPTAFPSIYGYLIELAANVAIDSVRTTMAGLSSVYEETCCCFSPNDLMVYQKHLARA
ncbi:MAG: macro domain-containing protein [Nitrospira sp.]